MGNHGINGSAWIPFVPRDSMGAHEIHGYPWIPSGGMESMDPNGFREYPWNPWGPLGINPASKNSKETKIKRRSCTFSINRATTNIVPLVVVLLVLVPVLFILGVVLLLVYS